MRKEKTAGSRRPPGNGGRRLCLLLALLAAPVRPLAAAPAGVTVVTPYLGVEKNIYRNRDYGLNLADSATMKGLYVQSVQPGRRQWNCFFYRTADINYSELSGVHAIYDHYFGRSEGRRNVAGIGANYLRLDGAGRQVPTATGILDGFSLSLDTLSLYARAGRNYDLDRARTRWSVMPWAGFQYDRTRGSGLVDFPGPGTAAFTVDSDRHYLITGLNLKAVIHHFLHLELKHNLTLDRDDTFHKTSAMANIFFTRHLGLSWRYNRQETTVGRDRYHLFGAAVVF